MSTINNKLLEALKEIIEATENAVNEAKEFADEFNNNAPGVGSEIPYMASVPFPSWYNRAKEAITEAEQQEETVDSKHTPLPWRVAEFNNAAIIAKEYDLLKSWYNEAQDRIIELTTERDEALKANGLLCSKKEIAILKEKKETQD